jgi:hypothetical protein
MPLLNIVGLFAGRFASMSLPCRDFQIEQVLKRGFLGGEHLPQQDARLLEPLTRAAAFEFETGERGESRAVVWSFHSARSCAGQSAIISFTQLNELMFQRSQRSTIGFSAECRKLVCMDNTQRRQQKQLTHSTL